MGLHRKNTVEDWYWYLGKEIVDQFWPDRIINYEFWKAYFGYLSSILWSEV